jgi:purine-cytosine permease-like protein
MKKNYRSVPPYMTKTGIQIGLIYQEPFEARMGRDEYAWQETFLAQNIKPVKTETLFIDKVIVATCVLALIAIILGSLLGTFFMAFHSAQGPQLGLPQLVQSRAQYGYIGAALTVWIFALVNYWAYNTADAILSGGAINALVPSIPANIGFLLAAIVASVIAIYGYDQIHAVNKLLLWPSLLILIFLTLGVFARGSLPAGAFDLGNFALAPFMTVFVIIAGFQLGWAPYVSDYSRYLPGDVGVSATFKWTYLPSALSGVWVFGLGALASSPGSPSSRRADRRWSCLRRSSFRQSDLRSGRRRR